MDYEKKLDRQNAKQLLDEQRKLPILPLLISTGEYQVNREFLTTNFFRFNYATNKLFERYFSGKYPLLFGKFVKNKQPISMLPTEWVYRLFSFIDKDEVDVVFKENGFRKVKNTKYYDGKIKECFVLKKQKLYEIIKGQHKRI